MNVNLALEALISTAHQLVDSPDQQARSLAEQVLTLDEWFARGAPLPDRWSDPRATWASAGKRIRYHGALYCAVE